MRTCRECARSAPGTTFTPGLLVCNECLKHDPETRRRALATFVLGWTLSLFAATLVMLEVAIPLLIFDIGKAEFYASIGRSYTINYTWIIISTILFILSIFMAAFTTTIAVKVVINVKQSTISIEKIAPRINKYLLTRKARTLSIYKLQSKFWLAREELMPVLEAMIAHNRIPYGIDDVHDVLERVG